MIHAKFLQSFDLDLSLREASLDPGVSVGQRTLAALLQGCDPDKSILAVRTVMTLYGRFSKQSGLSISADLAPTFEVAGADLARAVYFAVAGRGIGRAVRDLEAIHDLLLARSAANVFVRANAGFVRKMLPAYVRREDGLVLKIDRDRIRAGQSLTCWETSEKALSKYDHPLVAVGMNQRIIPLARALATLTIGVGIDESSFIVRSLVAAMKAFWQSGESVGSGLSAILATEGSDFGRALFFATVGRDRATTLACFDILLEAIDARARLWVADVSEGSAFRNLYTPYVEDAPEYCIFDLGFVPGSRDAFLAGQ